MAVSVVRVTDVSKRFKVRKDNSIKERIVNFGRAARFNEEFWALRHVNLEIEAGSTIGLIGPNGSGKSTLLKAIGGIIQATSGTVERRGNLAALLELGAGFHPDLTGRENVYLNASILGMSRKTTEQHFDAIVDFAGIGDFIDTQVKFYSSGMYVRLAFAVAIHMDPDILLVDEVLAVGDEAFQQKCLNKIREFQREGRTIILVTHTLSQITDLCTRAVVLAKGSVVFDGNPDDAVAILRSGFKAGELAHDVEAIIADNAERGRIEAVRVLDVNGTSPIDGFTTGDTVVVEVDLSADSEIPSWGLGLHIDNPLEQLVVGASTGSLQQHPAGPLHGNKTCRFVLDNAQFGTGEYRVTIALMGAERREIARASQSASFRVSNPRRHSGPLSAEISFEDQLG